MKKIIFFIAIACLSVSAIAQRKVEKTLNFSGKSLVELKLQIADSIDIKTWSKNEVSIQGSININNNKYNDDYLVDFDESGNRVKVDARFDSKVKREWNRDSCDCNYRSEIVFVVYIPENAQLAIETINGNVVITGKTSEMKVSSISGYIDLAIPSNLQADLQLSTLTGTIYSNVAMNDTEQRKKSGNDVVGKYNGGGKPVNLKTISGNIFLRKP